ncbi:MAG: urease accessory protein UreD [Alphaproteobacteria bacterium]|nr:urease accessory protein UreD [Alphaproteobacteria bacterium]
MSRRGRLELGFARAPDGRTYLDRQFASYPFHICRPFYPDFGPARGMATVYVQSCSGGLYSGERLAAEITLGRGARAQVTTQASTIVHKGTYGAAGQVCAIDAGPETLVEYLPDPVILFPAARLESRLRVALDATASAVLFDSMLAHDFRGKGDGFDRFANEIAIVAPDGEPLVIDRFRITGDDFRAGGIGRMGGYACLGNVIAVAPGVETATLIDAARAATMGLGEGSVGVSRLPSLPGFSARILARDAVAMKNAMLRLWEVSRTLIAGAPPRPRRK